MNGFEWLLPILPLLVISVIYIFYLFTGEEDDDQRYYHDQRYLIGSKGGKVKK